MAGTGTASDTAAARSGPVGSGPARAVLARAFRDSRVRTLGFAYLFAAYSYIQPVGYRKAYSTLASRVAFATSFGTNPGLRLFYGEPHGLVSVGGYTAWRVGGTLAIVAAVFGLLAPVRAFRTEEETGRAELVLTGVIDRRTAFIAALGAIAAGIGVLFVAEFLGFVLGGLPAGGSAYLALATASVVPVFVGVGAVVSQYAPTRRMALALGGAAVGVSLLLRAVADTASGMGWLRWATPLGWAEELRPFSGARPAVLLLPLLLTVPLLIVAARIAARRDVGTGLLPARDTAEPRLRLLSSTTAQALRTEIGGLITWTASIAVFAFVLGVVSESVSTAGISKSVERTIAKLGSGSILSPVGYLSFVFFLFLLAVSLFVCSQVGGVRREESDQQLETVLALPVGRVRWLAGRLVLAACGAAGVAVVSGFFTWVGAATAGVDVSLAQMLEAGANCIPVGLLFLGIAALAFAVVPRASAAIAYGLVIVTFLWQAVGSLLGAPRWMVDLTPFAHVGLVPTQSFRAGAAAVMVGIGLLAALAALGMFRRRDLLGA